MPNNNPNKLLEQIPALLALLSDKNSLDDQAKKVQLSMTIAQMLNKKHSKTKEWRTALNELQQGIQFFLLDEIKIENPEICYQILIYIPKNIDQWDSTTKSFKEWVIDAILKEGFLEKAESVTENLDLLPENSSILPSIDDLGKEIIRENFLYELYYNQFIKDINKLRDFEKTRLRERPDITFKWLLLEKIKGRTWQEISTKFDIPEGTLSSFYSRNLKRFKPFFKEFL